MTERDPARFALHPPTLAFGSLRAPDGACVAGSGRPSPASLDFESRS
jgi:hypothetical protein